MCFFDHSFRHKFFVFRFVTKPRDVAEVVNRWESSNGKWVFGPKAHCGVPLARYT